MCFQTEIVDTSGYPTLHSFLPTLLRCLLHRHTQSHYLAATPRIMKHIIKHLKIRSYTVILPLHSLSTTIQNYHSINVN